MYTDKLIELIETSELPQMQKNILKGFVVRNTEKEEKEQADLEIVKTFGREKYIDSIVLSTDEVKIYKVVANPKDDWTIKFPYRLIYVDSKKGNWTRANMVSPTLTTAYLVYLGVKHLGENSQFVDFACQMLDIKIEE